MRPIRIALLIAAVAATRLPAQEASDPPPPVLPVPSRTIVAALVEALGDVDSEVRTNTAVALASLGADAVEPLMAALRDKNRDTRAAAAYALGQLGGSAVAATEPLLKALKDEDKEVRRQAAQALSRVIAAARPPATTEPRPLAPPVPITAPPPAFPVSKQAAGSRQLRRQDQ
jgi:HEAT repeat protein